MPELGAGSLSFLYPIFLALISWGFGSLMRTIAILRGWNPTRVFWVSAASFAVLELISAIAAPVLVGYFPEFSILISIPFNSILVTGVLSPFLNLALKVIFRDTLKQSVSRSTKSVSLPAPALSGHIFISYRRSDSADIVGRIYDRLIDRFGRNPIFKDVDSIPLGLDFKEYLDAKVSECSVLLAIIGDRWMEARDESGKERLSDPADFVRIEIESALARGIPVIPLLVRGAQIPTAKNLPDGLKKLVYRNGIPIRPDPDFHRDMDRLIAALEKYIQ